MLICLKFALNNAFEAMDSPTKKNARKNVATKNVSKFF